MLANALVPETVVREYHPHLYVDQHVPEPTPAERALLRGRVRPITHISVDGRAEAVWDELSPGLPLKVVGRMPIVRLRGGALRRILPCEFVALGGLPWSVGFGD